MRNVEIYREPVELYKLLKFEGLVSSGGEAKILIAEGQVKVNGIVETRKRKKIMAGDLVEFAGETLRIQVG
jgi:ribosome-associated protein